MTFLESLLQILISGLSLGGIYAVSAIGLALLWGVMGMLNMAHGSLMAVGAYSSVFAVSYLGGAWYAGLPAGIVLGGVAGLALYFLSARWMLRVPQFEMNVIIATVGIAIALKGLLIVGFSGYQQQQPFALSGGFRIDDVLVPYQAILIVGVAVVLMSGLNWTLKRTSTGLAIRATAQNRRAAALMGIPANRVYLRVITIAGILAAISGVLVSSKANVSPSLGEVTMLKVLIICVVAGLGNLQGTIFVAFGLAIFEAAIQYSLSAQWAFPILLIAAIGILIVRPNGLFESSQYTKM